VVPGMIRRASRDNSSIHLHQETGAPAEAVAFPASAWPIAVPFGLPRPVQASQFGPAL
jgi:hypothetical protein